MYSDLARVINRSKYSYLTFSSFCQLLRQFAIHALVYSCCTNNCNKFDAPICYFLTSLSFIVDHMNERRCCHRHEAPTTSRLCLWFIKKMQINM